MRTASRKVHKGRWRKAARRRLRRGQTAGRQAVASALKAARSSFTVALAWGARAETRMQAWLCSPLAYFLVHLPLALAGIGLIVDHDRALATVELLLKGGTNGSAFGTMLVYLIGLYVAVAFIAHIWFCARHILRVPKFIRFFVFLEIPSICAIYLLSMRLAA